MGQKMSEIFDSSNIIKFTIPIDVAGVRLDKYVGGKEELKISRSKLQKLIESGFVTVDGTIAEHNHILKGGEKVVIKRPLPELKNIEAENIPLDIVYEDKYMLVVNKPSGMVTHPAAGHYKGTLVNALMYYTEKLSGLGGPERLGIVHRLDRDTSGLIMIARNEEIHRTLQEDLKERKITKKYSALICGHVKEDTGVINMPIGRSIKNRKKMTVTNVRSREALTEYKLIDRFKLYDLLDIDLKTGRTHQIRVHFSHRGHPVFGDAEYGGREKWHRGVISYDKLLVQKVLKMFNRQALHARSLQLNHPVTKELITIDSDLPEDFRQLLKFLNDEGR